MGETLLTLGKEEIEKLIKEKYPNASHVELYIEYSDEDAIGNDQIIADVNISDERSDSVV